MFPRLGVLPRKICVMFDLLSIFLLFYITLLKDKRIVSYPRGERGFDYSTLDWLKLRSAYVLLFGG